MKAFAVTEPKTPSQLLRIAEASQRLALKPSTVRLLIRSGKLPVVRPTGQRAVRVREADIERLIADGSAKGGK